MTELYQALTWLPDAASSHALRVDRFGAFLFLVGLLGGLGVAMIATVRVLRGIGRPRTAPFERAPHGRKLEAALMVALLGGFVASWVVGFDQYLTMQRPPAEAERIYVVAKQWMWKSVYSGGQIELDRIVVPAGRPVELHLTSRDVIHSLFVPALRVKRDVVPGRFTVAWFEVEQPGRWPISCAEFCGHQHAEMKAELVALAPGDWAAWREGGGSLGGLDLAAWGAEVAAEHACLGCHAVTDLEPEGAFSGPSWVGLYGATKVGEDGSIVVADEEYLTRSMMRPSAFVVQGFEDLMPTYQGQLEPMEVAALLEWIRSLSGEPP